MLVVAPLGFFVGASLLPDNRPPQLVLPPYPWNAGDGKPGQVVRTTFFVANTGGQPLEFQLVPGCGCTELSPREGIVDPRSKQPVEVAIRLGEAWGANRMVNINVQSNDPDRPSQQLSVVAKCPALFQVSPTHVEFGICPVNHERSIDVVVRGGDGKLFEHGKVGWTLERSAFSVSSSTSDGDMVLRVSLPAQATPGAFRSSLVLTNAAGDSLRVPIRAEVVGDILVAPRFLTVHSSPLISQKLVVWRPDGADLQAPIQVECPTYLAVSDTTPAESPRRIFDVRLSSDFSTVNEQQAQIILRFSDCDVPVVVTARLPVGKHVAELDTP